MSDGYEAGYIHGAAFARLSIAITALGDARSFLGETQDAEVRAMTSRLVEIRDGLARSDDDR